MSELSKRLRDMARMVGFDGLIAGEADLLAAAEIIELAEQSERRNLLLGASEALRPVYLQLELLTEDIAEAIKSAQKKIETLPAPAEVKRG